VATFINATESSNTSHHDITYNKLKLNTAGLIQKGPKEEDHSLSIDTGRAITLLMKYMLSMFAKKNTVPQSTNAGYSATHSITTGRVQSNACAAIHLCARAAGAYEAFPERNPTNTC
jgi:hypothetical protein